MDAAEGTRGELIAAAAQLRARSRRNACPVLAVAAELDVAVKLIFHSGTRRDARISLKTYPPEIQLFRVSHASGSRALTPQEEGLLSPRERFSVAHELAHWIAYDRLRIQPSTEESEYWRQEQLMDEFAAKLLVPDDLVDLWISDLAGCLVPTGVQVRQWAREAKVSEEVVAKALCRNLHRTGFLRLIPHRLEFGNQLVLRVQFSCYSAGIKLPNLHAHIKSPVLQDYLDYPEGQRTVRELRLGRCPPQDLTITWWQRGARSSEAKSGIWPKVTHWLAAMSPKPTDDQSQLQLFAT